ncbi:MAG: DUF418 domain-containing protein [Chloroflexi bacterium]|nr:DUF418 domain-containing protein [Chloroflexota bacterium]
MIVILNLQSPFHFPNYSSGLPYHIATFIFYGFGLGLYGTLNRVEQMPVILLIWTFQIALSSWWLERFPYGCLTETAYFGC